MHRRAATLGLSGPRVPGRPALSHQTLEELERQALADPEDPERWRRWSRAARRANWRHQGALLDEWAERIAAGSQDVSGALTSLGPRLILPLAERLESEDLRTRSRVVEAIFDVPGGPLLACRELLREVGRRRDKRTRERVEDWVCKGLRLRAPIRQALSEAILEAGASELAALSPIIERLHRRARALAPSLKAKLDHPEAEARALALRNLRPLTRNPERYALLTTALDDPARCVVHEALGGLMSGPDLRTSPIPEGADPEPIITRALAADRRVQFSYGFVLARFGEDVLREAARRAKERGEVAILAEWSREHRVARRALEELYQDADPERRAAILARLLDLGLFRAIPNAPLFARASGEDSILQDRAREAGRLFAKSIQTTPLAVEALVELLEGAPAELRREIVALVTMNRWAAGHGRPIFERAARDPDPETAAAGRAALDSRPEL